MRPGTQPSALYCVDIWCTYGAGLSGHLAFPPCWPSPKGGYSHHSWGWAHLAGYRNPCLPVPCPLLLLSQAVFSVCVCVCVIHTCFFNPRASSTPLQSFSTALQHALVQTYPLPPTFSSNYPISHFPSRPTFSTGCLPLHSHQPLQGHQQAAHLYLYRLSLIFLA